MPLKCLNAQNNSSTIQAKRIRLEVLPHPRFLDEFFCPSRKGCDDARWQTFRPSRPPEDERVTALSCTGKIR